MNYFLAILVIILVLLLQSRWSMVNKLDRSNGYNKDWFDDVNNKVKVILFYDKKVKSEDEHLKRQTNKLLQIMKIILWILMGMYFLWQLLK